MKLNVVNVMYMLVLSECVNTLKKQIKYCNISNSDEDINGNDTELEEEQVSLTIKHEGFV